MTAADLSVPRDGNYVQRKWLQNVGLLWVTK